MVIPDSWSRTAEPPLAKIVKAKTAFLTQK
jgi:hypothetical protein